MQNLLSSFPPFESFPSSEEFESSLRYLLAKGSVDKQQEFDLIRYLLLPETRLPLNPQWDPDGSLFGPYYRAEEETELQNNAKEHIIKQLFPSFKQENIN